MRSPQHHLPRKVLYAIQPHTYTPLRIHRQQQRQLRQVLVFVCKIGLPYWPALHKYQPAHLVIRQQFCHQVLIIIFPARVCGHHEKLPYALALGQFIIHTVHPMVFGSGVLR